MCDLLYAEIVDFCEFVAPTEEEQRLRAEAVQRVTGVVKTIWPTCEVLQTYFKFPLLFVFEA